MRYPSLCLILCGGLLLAHAEILQAQTLAEAPISELEPAAVEVEETEVSVLADPAAEVLAEPVADLPPARDDEESDPVARLTTQLNEVIQADHPWARFEPGAWRRMRTVSEAFDGEGAFAGRSLTERTERLVAIDEATYTLQVETVVALAGRKTPGPSETNRLSRLTHRPVELGPPDVQEGESTSISLGELMAPCKVWRLIEESPNGSEEQTLYVSDETVPALLRRESQATLADERVGTRRVMSVTRLQAPMLYGDQLTRAWHASTETTHPGGTRTERLAICGTDAPGGVFWEAVTEYGASGLKSRWAVSELAASGRTEGETIESEKNDSGVGVEVEIRPRRFLRMLRRSEPPTDL